MKDNGDIIAALADIQLDHCIALLFCKADSRD
jgi:hypothetical protein